MAGGPVLWKALRGRIHRADRVERTALALLLALASAPLTRFFVEWPRLLENVFLLMTPALVVVTGLALSHQLTIRPGFTGLRVRRAIRRGEMYLAYQPKLDLDNGGLEGVEALVRWRHPRHGLMPPNDWVGLVEQSPFEAGFNRWVLEQAIAQAAQWRADGQPVRVAVNLSPGLLDDETLPDVIAALLERYDVPPDAIELEVTERALESTEASIVTERLLGLGMRIVLDDFGIGYSSLSRLVRLPLDGVKIDRSFVADMANNPRSDAVVSWAARLARNLGLSLAAEGVETDAALSRLRLLGVSHAQGFLVARPLTPDQLDAWRADLVSPAAPPLRS